MVQYNPIIPIITDRPLMDVEAIHSYIFTRKALKLKSEGKFHPISYNGNDTCIAVKCSELASTRKNVYCQIRAPPGGIMLRTT